MPKRIVFCADGTWNGPGKVIGTTVSGDQDDAGELAKDSATNVWKLFCNLAGELSPDSAVTVNEKEKFQRDAAGQVTQVAKYIHGVGDSSNTLEKVFGGVFGAGIISRVVRGFTFISRHYQPGDDIVIVGFSRGAYTARTLAGMISRVGLLDATKYDVNDKEAAYRRGFAAWQLSRSLKFTGKSAVTRMVNRAMDWVGGLLSRRQLLATELIADVPIKAVAVWDTVGSLGVPMYLRDGRMDLFRFTDEVLSDKVAYGFHSMAIDELRKDFPVTKWQPRAGISQLWFVGAHADVGGGYPQAESRLSDVAFDWMMRRLGNVGVNWSDHLACVPDCQCNTQQPHEPWNKPPFSLFGTLGEQARTPNKTDVFHQTVKDRLTIGAYHPAALKWMTPELLQQLQVDA
jgi:uncharacterized protein (DUF2235 family)